MKCDLNDFAGRYACIPDAVRQITTPDEYALFSAIYSYGCRVFHETLVNKSIPMSRRNLQKIAHMGQIKIKRIIDELEQLNILSSETEARKKKRFTINWKEILFAHRILSGLSYDGVNLVADLCRKNGTIPVSKLGQNELSEICQKYKFRPEDDELDEEDTTGLILFQNSENISKSIQSNENEPATGLILFQNFKNISKSIQSGEKEEMTGLILNKNGQIDQNRFKNLTKSIQFAANLGKIYQPNFGDFGGKTLQFAHNWIDFEHNWIDFEHDWIDFEHDWIDFVQKRLKKVSKSIHSKYIRYKKDVEDERSESSYIGGEKKKVEKVGEDLPLKNFEPFEPFKNFEGLEIINLVEPSKENQETPSLYKQAKKERDCYCNKPFFKKSVAKNFIESLELCKNSPVKLFYSNLWWGLYDWHMEAIENLLDSDEYGAILEDHKENVFCIEGEIISSVELARVVKQAWGETADQIECGFIQLEDDKVTLKIEELPADIKLQHLLVWEKAVTENNEQGFRISLEGLRDIETEDAVEVKTPRSKEEKKLANRTNRQFMAALMTTEDSQLTPMEIAIKDFARTFVSFSDQFFVEYFTNGKGDRMGCTMLPGFLIKPWTVKLVSLGIKQQDFYETFNTKDGMLYKDGGDLQQTNTLFSYAKVVRWNSMNGFQSTINEETLRNALKIDDWVAG